MYSVLIVSAFMRGDPHITTIDGKTYTFNGLGEYWLIETRNPVTAGAQVQLIELLCYYKLLR